MNTQCKKLISIVILTVMIFPLNSCESQDKKRKDTAEPTPVTSIENLQKVSAVVSDTVGFIHTRPQTAIDFRAAARKVTRGVVHVNSTWKSQGNDERSRQDLPFKDFFGDDWFHFFEPFRQHGPVEGSASGVILTPDGYIITNNHVVQDADEVEVVLYDQRSYKATIIGSDPKTDLSLLKIDGSNLSFVEFGNSDDVEVGEWVLAVGNPFNLASTVTAGIVSAKARNINILKDREAVESFIQTDAAVNPGNSGGALVDLDGKLIGINSAIATPTGTYAGYSFAIPVNIVKKVADDLLNFGEVQRGYLGVIIRDMTSALAKDRNVEFTPGVFIDSLAPNGAAQEAGIKPRDIIINIDENRIETTPELQEIIAKHRPGEKVKVTLVRNGEKKQVTVVLKGPEAIKKATGKEGSLILQKLGIEIVELTQSEKEQYHLKGGVKVTQITEGTVRNFTDIRKGFVITRINGSPVYSKEDFSRILSRSKGPIMLEGTYPGSGGHYSYGFNI